MKDVRGLPLDDQLAYFRGKQSELAELAKKRDDKIEEHVTNELKEVNNAVATLQAELKSVFGVEDGKPLNTLEIVELVQKTVRKMIDDDKKGSKLWVPN